MILIGGIDLAVGSVLALAMMVMGYLANELGMALPLAIVFALLAAAFAGLISGLLITSFGCRPSSLHWHDVRRTRAGEHDYRRAANRGFPRLVQSPGHHPLRWLPDRYRGF